ncbi:MAG: glycosyltransferase family 87 protein [Pseudomonadota bacterium]
MGQDHGAQARRTEAAALVLLLGWALSVALRDWNVWADDLSALYFAARFAAEGAWDLAYAAPAHIIGYGMTPEWDAEAAALGYPGAHLNRYVYPPLWAALFAPLAARLDPLIFYNGFVLLHLGAVLAGLLACRRMIPERSFSPLVLAGLSVLLLESSVAGLFLFDLVQPQALVIGLCLCALERAQSGRQTTAGLLLAIAASIKIAPGLLVLAFVVCGMWGAVRAFALFGAALLALSVLLAGVEAHRLFLTAAAELDGIVFLLAINPSASALLWVLDALWTGVPLAEVDAKEVVAKPAWIGTAVPLLALTATAATLWIVRRTPKADRVWLAGGMLYLVMTLFGGFAWLHYMVLPLLMLPGLAGLSPLGRGFSVVLFFGLLQSIPFYKVVLDLFPAPVPQILLGIAVTLGFWAMMAQTARRLAAGAASSRQDESAPAGA